MVYLFYGRPLDLVWIYMVNDFSLISFSVIEIAQTNRTQLESAVRNTFVNSASKGRRAYVFTF